MINCVIYKKSNNDIQYFIQNCYQQGNDFFGSNLKLRGINLSLFSILWTNDTANPILDPTTGQITGWDKKMSELVLSSEKMEIKKTADTDYRAAIKIRQFLADKTYADIDNYIDANVTDLQSAKAFLKQLSRIVLAITRMMDK